MRTLPFVSAVARGVHALITIELFASTLRVTTADLDITIGGDTWFADAAVNLTQILYTADGTPAGADVRITPDGTIVTIGMARRGLLDGRPITIEIFDVGNPADGTFDMLPNATIGSAAEDSNGVVVIAAQGPLVWMNGPVTEVHSLTCKAKFGDDRCHIPLDVPDIGRNVAFVTQATPSLFVRTSDVWGRVFQSGSYNDIVYECTVAGTTGGVQPVYSTVIGGLTNDGTIQFTARQAWLVAAVGEGLDFFDIQLTATPFPAPTVLGNIIPQDGPLAGIKIPIRAFDSGTNIVTTFEPFAPSNFPTGTNFMINRGCDKLFETCRDVFLNKDNFRGAPYAPGTDYMTSRA